MLCDVIFSVVERSSPRSMALAMLNMKRDSHNFLYFRACMCVSSFGYGATLDALRAIGAPL